MKNMNCVNTMPEIMPEITDEAIIEALFAQRPYEEKVINSAFLEIPAEYQRKLNIPNVEKMSAEFTELIANPPKVSYRDGHYFVFDGQHTIVTRRAMNGGQDLPIICKVYAVLIQSVAISGDAINSIWSIVGYTVLLCFSLFKTSSVTKSVLGAH